MRKPRICKICGDLFVPDKYHPRQEVCSNSECQHQRQGKNQKKWRRNNPEYFKYKERGTFWEKRRAQYLKDWRDSHKEYFKDYRKKRSLFDRDNGNGKKKQKFGLSS